MTHAASQLGGAALVLVVGLLQQATESESSDLENAKTIVEIVGGVVTALAVLIGGGWALWRFGKERTYRPRLEIDLSGEWLDSNGTRLLLTRVRVKNISTSAVNLRQRGSGLRISRLAGGAASVPAGQAAWLELKTCAVFVEHAWVEPDETVSDDLLLRVDVPTGEPVLLEARLVWENDLSGGPVVVFARKVMSASETVRKPPDN